MDALSTWVQNVQEQYRENPLTTILYVFFMGSAVVLLFESTAAIYLYYQGHTLGLLGIPIVHSIIVVLIAILHEDDIAYLSKKVSR